MTLLMRRRDLIAGAAALAVPGPPAHAQQTGRARRVGVLIAFPDNDPFAQSSVKALAAALARLGWDEGSGIRLDFRYAAGDPVLFKKYAAELVALAPDVILASTPPAVTAVRAQTQTIPVVFVYMVDPIGLGLVKSLAHPGGNVTGFGSFDPPLMTKWMQLLKEAAPCISRVGIVFNPETTVGPAFTGGHPNRGACGWIGDEIAAGTR